jgi:ATP-binding protein involved in chromosome partitioning
MAYYQLPDGSKDYIFGRGGGEKLAKVLKTELLAQIPLGQADPNASMENPSPSIYPEDSLIGKIYAELGERIIQKVE